MEALSLCRSMGQPQARVRSRVGGYVAIGLKAAEQLAAIGRKS